jgi:Uma2 family endonuclease
MLMSTETAPWTRHDLERFPDDGNRYEVLDGELLVTPQAAFDHQLFATRLIVALGAYLGTYGAGIVVGPGAVIFGESELQPDVLVLPRAKSVQLSSDWKEMPVPLLAIEVLSPTAHSRRHDLELKRRAYLRIGVQSYWVVDPPNGCVHVWEHGDARPTIVSKVLHWQPRPDSPPFELTVGALLAPVE